jgi:arylsulfatase
VLLVVLDDVGFNDLGLFGSEINTPTIDALASAGMVLTEFHVAPNCSPTRAMLLSGVDHHLSGLGNMDEELAPNQVGKPGYEGFLNFSVAALPEVMKEHGYNTYMAGKWHLGLSEETGPAARGFDRSFALLEGGAGAFENMLSLVGPGKAKYREDGVLLSELPDGFYSSEFYTDRMIRYIENGREDGAPFFAYLAYTAAHWPLQAPAKSISRYRGVYEQGYDKLRMQRQKRLLESGFLSQEVEATPREPGELSWSELDEDQRRVQARIMEVYAAMIDDVDFHFGRLISYLNETDQFENTLIILLSDNGPEAHNLDLDWDVMTEWVAKCCDNSLDNIGGMDSYVWYGPNWGIGSNTPMRGYKAYTAQGGVRVPAIIHFPPLITEGRTSDAIVSVRDVMPTILDIADIDAPDGEFLGRKVLKIQGRSLSPLLRGAESRVHPADYTIGWELFGKRALRRGEWKIIYEPYHELMEPRPAGILTDTWQLYKLSEDPGERNDLSRTHPELLAELIEQWNTYAAKNNVIIPNRISAY